MDNRRSFLTDGRRLGGALAGLLLAQAANQAAAAVGPRPDAAPDGIAFTMFSRHLQWVSTQGEAESLPYDVGVRIGEKAQEIGYQWIDLTVRSTGHVDPSRVDVAVNLPLMLNGIRSTGAKCRHMTCNIVDTTTAANTRGGVPVMAEDILRVANDNGIALYRWGGFSYTTSEDTFGKQLLRQLDAFAERVAALATLNRSYGATALYHTFSGGNNGRSVWDLMHMLERFDPADLALNFDIGHMVTESALSAWRSNVRHALPYIKSVGLKDGLVQRNASTGAVASSWAAAGQGMVQWKEFFQLLLEGGYTGPAEAQYEYNVTGLNNQSVSLNTTFWSDHAQFASGNITPAFMTEELKKDLAVYRQAALDAGWPAARLS
ncbi:TIM barrel protein [Pseudorhodoferax sp. LjRoot39]|uniref:sugar phosphate isomerase/epimerase family protein n=1 Tax=Pseudorhodoferax sp. LjRoot39 TaxID=3342328 RepID=UPI003ECC4B4F